MMVNKGITLHVNEADILMPSQKVFIETQLAQSNGWFLRSRLSGESSYAA